MENNKKKSRHVINFKKAKLKLKTNGLERSMRTTLLQNTDLEVNHYLLTMDSLHFVTETNDGRIFLVSFNGTTEQPECGFEIVSVVVDKTLSDLIIDKVRVGVTNMYGVDPDQAVDILKTNSFQGR